MGQKMVWILLLMVLAIAEARTPPGIANNPSHARCLIKKYKHCYNLEHVCPKFCPDSCTVECVSCKPICGPASSPPPSDGNETPPKSSPPENDHGSGGGKSPPPSDGDNNGEDDGKKTLPKSSPPENAHGSGGGKSPPPNDGDNNGDDDGKGHGKETPPESSPPEKESPPPYSPPTAPSTPSSPPPPKPTPSPSPSPPEHAPPITPSRPPSFPPQSPSPSTPTPSPPGYSPPNTPSMPPSSPPQNPSPSTPTSSPPPSTPTSPPSHSSPPSTPATPTASPPLPTPSPPSTPSTTPSAGTPPLPTATPPSSPVPIPTPPSHWSPPPPSDSSEAAGGRRKRCKNRNYPQCYSLEHVCPSSCPYTCEVDCVTCKPVCKCDMPGAVCQDPRFIGGDGITFYFHGKKDKDFCLVTQPNLHINAHFIGKRNQKMNRDFTWVQSIAILFGDNSLYVGAQKTTTWNEAVDRLSLTFDGEPISLSPAEGATWRPAALPSAAVKRDGDTNSVIIEVDGLFKISAKVVPITKHESEVHNYGITEDDCFAHLELGFKFYSLSGSVDGILGQTYRANYVSRAKLGVPMAVLGGEREFSVSNIFAADCSASQFRRGNLRVSEMGLELPSMKCGSGTDGRGHVCKL